MKVEVTFVAANAVCKLEFSHLDDIANSIEKARIMEDVLTRIVFNKAEFTQIKVDARKYLDLMEGEPTGTMFRVACTELTRKEWDGPFLLTPDQLQFRESQIPF